MPEFKLYDYQEELVAEIRKVWGQHLRIAAQAATGFGKTAVAAFILKSCADRGMKCVFLVPRVSLIQQAIDDFVSYGIDIRSISRIHRDYKTDYSCNIIVASTASFVRKEFVPFDLLVQDEMHLQNKQLIKRMEEHENERWLGITATPYSKGLGKRFSVLVKGCNMRHLIDLEGGGLCDYDMYAPSIPNLKDISVRGGEYAEEELARVMGEAKIIGDVVSNWVEHGENRPTIVLPVNIAHANQIQKEFEVCGIASEVITGKTPIEEREAIFKRVENDTLKIMISVGVLTEGISIKKISCIVSARPTKSKTTWIQGIGRALRYMTGKRALIFDHGGTSLTLGLPEDIGIDELDDGTRKEQDKKKEKQRKEQEALPKPCSRCGALRPPGNPQCPKCGHITKRCEDVEVNRQLGLKILKGETKKAPQKADKQRWWSELLGWQLSQKMHGKNISDGRIAHIYRDKFSVWPKGLDNKIISPSSELTSFIKSRNIAFAKAMQQKEGK